MAKAESNMRSHPFLRWSRWANLFLIFVNFFAFAVSSSSSSASQSSTELLPNLKIMSYNIAQIPNILGLFDTDQENRLVELVKAIKGLKEKPHIIVFQELIAESDSARLGAELRHIFPYQVSLILEGKLSKMRC